LAMLASQFHPQPPMPGGIFLDLLHGHRAMLASSRRAIIAYRTGKRDSATMDESRGLTVCPGADAPRNSGRCPI
jgi:hypothetical protein